MRLRKILAMLLVSVLCVSMMPVGVFAGGEVVPSEKPAPILEDVNLTAPKEPSGESTGERFYNVVCNVISEMFNAFEVGISQGNNNCSDNTAHNVTSTGDNSYRIEAKVWESRLEQSDIDMSEGQNVRVFVFGVDYGWDGDIPVIKQSANSNNVTVAVPGPGESSYAKASDTPVTPCGNNGQSGNDSIVTSSSGGNGGDVVVAIAVGNVVKGKVYKGQIVEYQAISGGANAGGSNASSMPGGNGLGATVSVDQGGNDFGAYSFDFLSGAGAGNGTGIFNATINNAGNKFSHSKNGMYYPEGTAVAEFMINEEGVAVFTDGKNRLPGIYTILFLDEDGRLAYIYITHPSGSASAGKGKVGKGSTNKGNASNITLTPVPVEETECAIITYYSDGNVNATGTPMGGERTKIRTKSDGSKEFCDGKQREPGTYLVTFTDKSGNPGYVYVIVPGAGIAGNGTGNGSGSGAGNGAGSGDSSKGKGSDSSGLNTTDNKEGNALYTGTVKAVTSASGDKKTIDPSYEKNFYFNHGGVPFFADTAGMDSGVYDVTYTGADGAEHDIEIVVI